MYMSKVDSSQGSKDQSETSAPRAKSPAILMFATAADTTWRMFVPIIGATIFGLWIDKFLHTTPWLLVVCMVIGITLASILVLKQLQKVKK